MSMTVEWWKEQRRMVTIGIGEMKISADPEEILVTYALGSCIALTLYDPVLKIGGLIHCKLATAEKVSYVIPNPFVYVDVGVPIMLEMMRERRALKNRLVAKIFGAANVINDNGIFRIGEQNYHRMREVLAALGLPLSFEQVGGTIARTVYLNVGNGKAQIRSGRTVMEV